MPLQVPAFPLLRYLILPLFLCLFASTAGSQETNGRETLDAVLASKGPQIAGKKTCDTHCEGKMVDKYTCVLRDKTKKPLSELDLPLISFREACACSTECTTPMANFKLTDDPSVSFTKIEYAKPVFSDIPTRMNVSQATVDNCSALNQSTTQTMSVTYSETETFSWSKTVTKTKSFNFNLGVDIKFIKLGASHTVGSTVANTNGYTKTTVENVQKTVTVPVTVPPMNRIIVEAVIAEMPADVEVTIDALLDGPILPNPDGKVSASQVLTPEERRAIIGGRLSVSKATDIRVSFKQFPLSKEACSSNVGDALRERRKSFVVTSFPDDFDLGRAFGVRDEGANDNIGDDGEEEVVLPAPAACTATNPTTDIVCSASCLPGEIAYCDPNSGGNYPICSCEQ